MKDSIFRKEAVLYHRQRNLGKVILKPNFSAWLIAIGLPILMGAGLYLLLEHSVSTNVPVTSISETSHDTEWLLSIPKPSLSKLESQPTWILSHLGESNTEIKVEVLKINLACDEIRSPEYLCVTVRANGSLRELEDQPNKILRGRRERLLDIYFR